MADEKLNADRMAEDDKTRTCPTCRMEISVLAVRCRFCGSDIGRPKEAARELTISDLGGETIYHRAPSGSVLDAMEAFRAEEESDRTHHGSDGEEAAGGAGVEALPNLDVGSQDILGLSRSPTATSVQARRGPSGTDRLMTIGIAVVVLIVVIFASIKGVQYAKARQELKEVVEKPVYINRATSIMDQHGPPIDALKAALDADENDPNPRNSRILEDAFLYLKAGVDTLLDAEPFDLDNLRKASALAKQAVELHPNTSSIALKEEVDKDNSDYKLVLMPSAQSGTASFRLNNPQETVTVKRGDTILERFFVQSVVGKTVKLEDTLRSSRIVTFDGPGALPH